MSDQVERPWAPSSESLMEWDEAFHDLMLHDRLRMTTYRKAIFEAVQPGDVVLDLGTGTGILSQWALEAGAARVLGIDLNADILTRATERIRAAGLSDRFKAIRAVSYELALPQPVDLLISEIIGNVADNEDFQPILSDAIARLLKPGGTVLPRAVRSYFAPVSANVAHRALRAGQVARLSDRYDVQALYRRLGVRSAFDVYYDCLLPSELCLSEPQLLGSYQGAWDQPATYQRELGFTISRRETLTGFKGYFVAELTPQTVLDISGHDVASGLASDSWKHAYFPIEHPIEVREGDGLALCFARGYRDADRHFAQTYRWSGSVERAGEVVGRFDQYMHAAAASEPASEPISDGHQG